MTRELIRALICLSFAVCCFLNTWEEFAQGHVAYYARYRPLAATALTVAGMQTALAVGLYLAWRLLEHRGLLRSRITQLAFLCACAIPLGFASLAAVRSAPEGLFWIIRSRWFWPLVAIAAAPLLVAAARNIPRAGHHARRLLLYVSPVWLVILAQAASATLLRDGPADFNDGRTQAKRLVEPRRRIIWIIFDEMSQAIAFSHRPAGLRLPELDRLRAESVAALDAHAPSNTTKESIPALLLGVPVIQADPLGPRSLLVRTRNQPDGADFSALPNIFDRARDLGIQSGLAGWHHPYGRLLHRSLNEVYWTAGWLPSGVEETADPLSPAQAVLHRLRCQLDVFPGLARLRGASVTGRYQREQTALRHRALLQHAKAMAADPSLGLVFLHIPAPHPPAAYSRDTADFETAAAHSYLDGMALADWTLGEIRKSVDEAGLGSRTGFIVSADHGWRDIWPRSDEEARAAEGIDTVSQVPFLVKLPAQTAPATAPERFETLQTGELVLRILKGEITNPEDVLPNAYVISSDESRPRP